MLHYFYIPEDSFFGDVSNGNNTYIILTNVSKAIKPFVSVSDSISNNEEVYYWRNDHIHFFPLMIKIPCLVCEFEK